MREHHPTVNFNRFIDLSNGEYVVICHAEDVCAPTIVAKYVTVLQQDPEMGRVFTFRIIINKQVEQYNTVPPVLSSE
jgi:hypothetical protein